LRLFTIRSLGALILCASSVAFAEEPVRHVPVFVHPYYQSGATANDSPFVAVAGKYDQQLSSRDPAAIQEVAQSIDSESALITPMTLMVLAIRHYDVGLRDESVFWFYVAKDRYSTLNAVLDMRHPALSQAAQATAGFANLAGMTINGYAFCDLKKQTAARMSALRWVEEHPYEVIFSEQLPAKAGDRRQNLQAVIQRLKADAAKEAEFLNRPETLEKLTNAREKNAANEKYCW
jgi:hypothetical protein